MSRTRTHTRTESTFRRRVNLLPRKPSALLRLALADLEEVEQDSNYEIQMGTWHNLERYSVPFPKCHICLAGAVLANTIKLAPSCDVRQFYLWRRDVIPPRPFRALDSFRRGRVCMALRSLKVPVPAGMRDRNVPDYSADPIKFKSALRRIAVDLEKRGV